MRDLDAVVRNFFDHDASVLAEWESASHVERAPRRTETEEPPTDPSPAKA